MCGKKRDLVEERLGQNKILFDFQQSQTANSQIATIDFPILSTPERQISGFLPAFGSIQNQTDLDSSLSPHLVCFVACLFGRPYFRFAGSWIVGLAMGRKESRGANVTMGFSEQSLWKVLTIIRKSMTVK